METLYFLLGLASCIGLWLLVDKFLSDKVIEPIRNFPYTKFEKCNPPLGTMNGIGFKLFCGGRFDYDTNSQAWYLFFCFIIPLFPIGCYRATEVSNSGKGSSYRIYGYDKWRFWEVLLIYLSSYAWVGGVICAIGLIASFF